MAGVGGADGQGHVSQRSIVPVECKRRISGPDCLSAASFWAARRTFYRHLTAWRVASATCSSHAGFNESHWDRIAGRLPDWGGRPHRPVRNFCTPHAASLHRPWPL